MTERRMHPWEVHARREHYNWQRRNGEVVVRKVGEPKPDYEVKVVASMTETPEQKKERLAAQAKYKRKRAEQREQDRQKRIAEGQSGQRRRKE
jgi:hypothetical protein